MESSTGDSKLGHTFNLQPIGFIESCFVYKNGTPRQPVVCEASKARLRISAEIYNNPEHSLEGLEQFSHAWIMFIFHKNNNAYTKAKVKPPRLNGAKMGVFSTRSPYRLNPVGLTLAAIEKIEGATLHLSGVDMLDGTPVIDIKPYIPAYDQPQVKLQLSTKDKYGPSPPDEDKDTSCVSGEGQDGVQKDVQAQSATLTVDAEQSHKQIPVQESDQISSISSDTCNQPVSKSDKDTKGCPGLQKAQDSDYRFTVNDGKDSLNLEQSEECTKTEQTGGLAPSPNPINAETGALAQSASWVSQPPISKLTVTFTPNAESQLSRFGHGPNFPYQLSYIENSDKASQAISDILRNDPRSTYRRTKCQDKLYYFTVDTVHVTCWFDNTTVEVLKVQHISKVDSKYLKSS